MTQFSDRSVKALPLPEKGSRIVFDGTVRGFGVRITATGHKSFIFNYRVKDTGREKRLKIGSFPELGSEAARKKAERYRAAVNDGKDPVTEARDKREAPTVADLAKRFEGHFAKLRPGTVLEYRGILDRHILPRLGKRKVADVTYGDIERLHTDITASGAPYRANRTLSVLSKMFGLAVKWQMRADNPVIGVERNQEYKREYFLSGDELVRLSAALDTHHDQQAANIVRLLLLTGARRNEVQGARWDALDLETGVWTKRAHSTKQKKDHRIPLSLAAVALLKALRADAAEGAAFVFPSWGKTGYRVEIDKNWRELCKVTQIKGVRLHDLRHSFASVLASAGLSIPIVGSLLGHTQASTTMRYIHLYDDPLRKATQLAADIITAKPSAEIVPLKRA